MIHLICFYDYIIRGGRIFFLYSVVKAAPSKIIAFSSSGTE
ncbi:unnamed protein product [Brassica oleracea var. botrytis]|uniref:Uncharacterized protein n=2 Tax=Brassica TaxID=3705 RepID=A0A3P6GJA4_BRAOL